jgi:hypothetical protein
MSPSRQTIIIKKKQSFSTIQKVKKIKREKEREFRSCFQHFENKNVQKGWVPPTAYPFSTPLLGTCQCRLFPRGARSQVTRLPHSPKRRIKVPRLTPPSMVISPYLSLSSLTSFFFFPPVMTSAYFSSLIKSIYYFCQRYLFSWIIKITHSRFDFKI